MNYYVLVYTASLTANVQIFAADKVADWAAYSSSREILAETPHVVTNHRYTVFNVSRVRSARSSRVSHTNLNWRYRSTCLQCGHVCVRNASRQRIVTMFGSRRRRRNRRRRAEFSLRKVRAIAYAGFNKNTRSRSSPAISLPEFQFQLSSHPQQTASHTAAHPQPAP